jgi:hypothetical protein
MSAPYELPTSNTFGVTVVTVTGFDQETVNQSALGIHVGGDVSFFFSPFCVGAGIRVKQRYFESRH